MTRGQLSSSSEDQSPSRRTIASQRSIAARKVGSSCSSCRPIAHHCGPCPEQTNGEPGPPVGRCSPLRHARGRPPVGVFLEALRQLLLRVRPRPPGGDRDGYGGARRSRRSLRARSRPGTAERNSSHDRAAARGNRPTGTSGARQQVTTTRHAHTALPARAPRERVAEAPGEVVVRARCARSGLSVPLARRRAHWCRQTRTR